MATLMVSDESATGRLLSSWTIADLPDVMRVRDIIRTRVRDEVVRHNLAGGVAFNGLVIPSEDEAHLNGYVQGGRRRIDWERQAEIALRAFESNGFFVLVDDRQVSSLDELIDLRRVAKVSFVRLVALVGG